MLRNDLDKIAAYHPGRKHANAIKLSSNESSYPPAPQVYEAMAKVAGQANRYPDIVQWELREHLAEHLELTPEQIAVGTGSSALCQQLVQITCTTENEVIFPWRSFEAYPIFANVVGATPVPVPLTDAGYNDLDAMAAAVTDKTRLIFVCNPNNPTGTLVTRQAFAAFMDKIPSDVLVACDEAYIEFVRDADTPNALDLIQKYPNVVGLRTFSKAYGLAGARVGYAFGAPEIIGALQKVAIPFSVTSAAQAGAIAALDAHRDMQERTDEAVAQRDQVADFLQVARSQANFVWIPADHPAGGPHEIEEKLAQRDVLVRAFPEGVRVTITEASEMKAFMQAWQDAGLPHA